MLESLLVFLGDLILSMILDIVGEIPIGPKPDPNKKYMKRRRK